MGTLPHTSHNVGSFIEEHVLTSGTSAGFPMAKNLRAKIPKTDKLVVCDRNSEATSSFVKEAGAGSSGAQEIEVVSTPRKVAEQAVSHTFAIY